MMIGSQVQQGTATTYVGVFWLAGHMIQMSSFLFHTYNFVRIDYVFFPMFLAFFCSTTLFCTFSVYQVVMMVICVYNIKA